MRNIKLWSQIVNELTDDFPELMAPKERFARPDGIVSRSFCATSGLLPSKLCKDAGLVLSDIFNANFVPKEEDDSLIGGNMPLVVVDGEQIVAHENTPSEFTLESTGGIMFNPDFLKRMKYDKLGNLSVLFPRKGSSAWEKIGFNGSSIVGKEPEDMQAKSLSAPSNIKASDTKINWKHTKGELVVGYRIYYTSENSDSYSLIGHTVDPSYQLPDTPGFYHIRAVNYYGEESQPSANIIIEMEELVDDNTGEHEDEAANEENKDQTTESGKNENSNDSGLEPNPEEQE